MEKWSFNNMLFNRLSEILDISGAEIARRSGMKQQVLNRYMTNEIMLSVQTLTQICNALRMPIHFFVSEQNNHIFPPRELATILPEQWHPIGWDYQAVEQTFGDGRIYWKDVAAVMGVSPQKPHARFLLKTRFPITDFLSICNHFNLSPFKFLIDNNSTGTKKNTRRKIAYHDVAGELSFIRKQVANLSATVADLKAKYDSLSDKYAALQQSYNRLSHINRVSFENINDSYIGIAAESTPPYTKE